MKSFFSHIYLDRNYPYWIGGGVVLFLVSFFVEFLRIPSFLYVGLLVTLAGIEAYVLFFTGKVTASRQCPERLSNGDENPIGLTVHSDYRVALHAEVYDEMPFAFQKRDFKIDTTLLPGQTVELGYSIRPVERGEYQFGHVQVLVRGPLRLLARRFSCKNPVTVPVYPSFIQMRKYQLMTVANRFAEIGMRKTRRLGHTSEFEQIKEYVQGDDYRTVNWKATGRKGHLMVNQFRDERAQNIYCLIDKSRSMIMPFEGMTLLDYAINATLVLSNTALLKHDKAGICTFAEQIHQFVPAQRTPAQMRLILETLYNQTSRFMESDYEKLYTYLRRTLSHRCMLVLFTNFETLSGMERQWPALARLAKQHLLVVIFFENTELRTLTTRDDEDIEDIYIKGIGEQFGFEKRRIVLEMERHGIHVVLTPPENLTVSALNKYLELKARGLI